jgi:hypothetical protein
LSEFHGVGVGSAMTSAPASARARVARAASSTLKCDADVAGDAAANLYVVDEGGVSRIG